MALAITSRKGAFQTAQFPTAACKPPLLEAYTHHNPTPVRGVSALKRKTKTEMECALVFAGAPVGIVSVIEADGADGQFVTKTDAHRVTHVVEASCEVLKRIGRVWEQIAGINENRAEQFAINREGLLDVEDGVEFTADRIPIIVRAELAFAEAAHSRAAAVEESFVNRDFGRRRVAIKGMNDSRPRAQRE